MERDAASEATQAAQADFNAVREHYEAKKAEAEPHRVRRKSLREAAAQLQVGNRTVPKCCPLSTTARGAAWVCCDQ